MNLFTEEIEEVQEDIDNGLDQLFKSKNIDKIKDLLSFINFLNENIIRNQSDIYKLNREKLDRTCNLYRQLVGMWGVNSRYSKNFRNIAENYGLVSVLTKKILHGIDKKIEVDENKTKTAKYTDQEMISIIRKYYLRQSDFESLELLRKLIDTHSIYNIELKEEFGALSIRSAVLNKNYIILPNHRDFNTIVNLIHEIKHIKEWIKIEKFNRLIKYRENNTFVEVGSTYSEKRFIEYASRDQEFREQALNRHDMNYSNLKTQLMDIDHLFSSISGHLDPNISNLIYSYNCIWGEIISDVLLSLPKKLGDQFLERINLRKNLFFDYSDFMNFGLTTDEVAISVVKQYEKYR